ncbi:DeoR/GlpR family DNA-binding transcription regulator [Methylopila sp. 73B]|uniref:DeoR/GlpR family DNA-binding transcription regulator n=1 Tax=Methylopila sp. 73B TaxID=1120792 RepID=UPI00036B17ED|nr:DeoR/GlpR family DNA-binding transcription regulator [Methylopila sp. 73B]
MRPDERRERIVAMVLERERVSVDALADALDASRETIRRDLAELDGQGRLRKLHGGATLPGLSLYEPDREGPFQARLAENAAAKRAVARAAIGLFRPGDTLFVDTGTTTLLFAEELSRARGLTVITNSAAIAALASRGEDAQAFLLGGEYRDGGAECLGAMAIDQIRRFHAVHAVLTVGAVHEAGVLDYDAREAEIARAMVAQARAVTVLADASKFDRSAPFVVAPLEAISRIVTDAVPVGPIADALVAAGVEVVAARAGNMPS